MKDFDVMVAGHLCLDIIPDIPDTGAKAISDLFSPGKLVVVGSPAIGTGGSVSNTGIPLHLLGNRVCFCARVGDDEFGKITIEQFKKKGTSEGLKVSPGVKSSYSIVVAIPGIDRFFLHNPGSNDDFSKADLDMNLLARCRHFHFGYPTLIRNMYSDGGNELLSIFRTAREAGCSTSLDLTLPQPESESGKANWPAILKKVLPYVDLYTPSIEEALYTLHKETLLELKRKNPNTDLVDSIPVDIYGAIADELLRMGCKVVLLKAGKLGVYLRSAKTFEQTNGDSSVKLPKGWENRELWCPAYQVEKVISANGAGDCAIAGFLTGFLKNYALEVAVQFATCLGWQNVHVLDATSGIKSFDETIQLIQSNMPVASVPLKDRGWTWNEQRRIWNGPHDKK